MPPIVCGARGVVGVHHRAPRRPLRCSGQLAWPQRVPPSPEFREQGLRGGASGLRAFPYCPFLTDHSSFRGGCMSKETLLCQTLISPLSVQAPLKLSNSLCSPVCCDLLTELSLSVCLSVCAVCSLVSYSLIQPETGSWFPCLVTGCPGLKGGSQTCHA